MRISARALAAMVFLGTLAPAGAMAQTEIVVLEIRSVEGDDDFAANLTGALRQAARSVSGWTVSAREVSLAQMSLAFGCPDPSAACMAEIASHLGAGALIYGTVERTGSGQSYDFELTLTYFDAETGELRERVADTIPGTSRDIDDLRDRAERYVATFSGEVQTGTLRVNVNIPNASVAIDGSPAGFADVDGGFTSDAVAEGEHTVEVTAEGYRTYRGSVSVRPGETFELDVELEEGTGVVDMTTSSGGLPQWPGFALLGAGAVFGVAALVAGIQANGFERQQFDEYRSMFLMGDSSVCPEARDGVIPNGNQALLEAARQACDDGDRLFKMQIAMGIVGGALGAAGIVWLILAGRSDEERDPNALTLVPSIGREGGGLSARLRF